MTTDPIRIPLDVGALRAELAGVDGPWRTLDVVDETGSTNADLLSRSAAGDDISGAVLLAEYQRAGRGRHGRAWSAPRCSQIAMSVGIAAGPVPPDGWGWLPLLTGVAVVDAIRGVCGIDAGLKWPNDVLVGSGKLAGILAEVAAPAPVIVVGLGLNVTMTPAEVPDPAAVSLLMLESPVTDRHALAGSILRELKRRVDAWQAAGGAGADLIDDYRARSVTLGAAVRASLPGGREIVGVAADIDRLGRLRIDAGGESVTVSAGDITHLRPVADSGAG